MIPFYTTTLDFLAPSPGTSIIVTFLDRVPDADGVLHVEGWFIEDAFEVFTTSGANSRMQLLVNGRPSPLLPRFVQPGTSFPFFPGPADDRLEADLYGSARLRSTVPCGATLAMRIDAGGGNMDELKGVLYGSIH